MLLDINKVDLGAKLALIVILINKSLATFRTSSFISFENKMCTFWSIGIHKAKKIISVIKYRRCQKCIGKHCIKIMLMYYLVYVT